MHERVIDGDPRGRRESQIIFNEPHVLFNFDVDTGPARPRARPGLLVPRLLPRRGGPGSAGGLRDRRRARLRQRRPLRRARRRLADPLRVRGDRGHRDARADRPLRRRPHGLLAGVALLRLRRPDHAGAGGRAGARQGPGPAAAGRQRLPRQAPGAGAALPAGDRRHPRGLLVRPGRRGASSSTTRRAGPTARAASAAARRWSSSRASSTPAASGSRPTGRRRSSAVATSSCARSPDPITSRSGWCPADGLPQGRARRRRRRPRRPDLDLSGAGGTRRAGGRPRVRGRGRAALRRRSATG